MSVHYKFKSSLNFDTVTFDGLHISVSDLKKSIIHQKRLGKTADFDLQITNAQTKEEYTDDLTLIPKNTSLIVARIPLAVQPKKPWDPQADKVQGIRSVPEPDSGTLDLSQMNGTEEDKIQAMMIQSTMDYDPNNYQKIRGQGQTGEVPANYRCFKCHKPGHWIKNCPLGSGGESIDVKRNTGIPRSFIERDSQEKTAQQNPEPPPPVVEKKQEIPDDLICSICKDLFTDAVMIPCCGSSFCDECVRTALLESEDNECPDCKEKGSSPGSLIPNRFLRNSVNAFRNETGYNKPRQRKAPSKPKELIIADESNDKKEEKKDQPNEEDLKEKESKKDETEKHSSKEKKDADVSDRRNDAGTHSSHDEIESDFEDNITVTVPPAHLQTQRASFRDRMYNGRHSRHLKPPGMENSPKNNSNSQTTPSHEDRSGTPTIDEKEHPHHSHEHKQHPIPSHQPPHRDQMRPHRSTPSDMYGNAPPTTTYPPNQPIMAPGRPYDMGNVYGVPPGGYVPFMMGDRMRGPFHPIRPGYPQPHQMRPRHMAPSGTLASVYQGVAAKVGPGIIDDPLEAFNRIMREKEKRKEERRRSPMDSRRRSRSIELNPNRGRHSPMHHSRPPRLRTPDDRRMRSPPGRERRGRSRDKRSMDKEKRRHRSSSFSDRSSRSRSWSIPRKRSKSPVMRRRSRTRSPSFSLSRSRSRSLTQGRFRGQPLPIRYNRSPPSMRTVSPRYRQKENRRPERREDFQREEFRERSPGNYQSRRPKSRGRMQSPVQFFRQDRQPTHGGEQYFHMSSGAPYNEGPYPQNNNRYSREQPHGSSHREQQYGRDRGGDYKMERFDDAPPPGTDEPPPPGFENSPQRERRNSWGHNPFDDRQYRDDFRKEGSRKEYIERGGQTPDGHQKHSLDREDRRRHDMREREGRSWSRTSRHSSIHTHGLEKRRKSRSKTPVRLERIQEGGQYQNREHSSKDRFGNKERMGGSRDRQMHGFDREKIEHDKRRDREDRERKMIDHSRDKKDLERRLHEKEKEIRRGKEYREREKEREKEKEKEKEKEREKEKEKEKERKKESSEDEKKEKKAEGKKEKRKKKKEKDQERKKNKKERKEKEKKEKEKDKEKENKKEILEESKEEQEEEEEIEESEPQPQLIQIENVMESLPEDDKTVELTREDGELLDEEDAAEEEKQKENEMIDLYADICQEEEIRYDYNNTVAEEKSTEIKSPIEEHKASPPDFKRVDSVLDIHATLDFEPDLDEMESVENKKDNVLVSLPELSKWERDDENQQSKDERKPPSIPDSFSGDDKSAKVTNEVLKRAENAIFARAINAIRPIEIKKISDERKKLYSNEMPKELSPVSSVLIQAKSPNTEMATFQITVPTNSTSERSVEIKSDKQKRSSPVRSVKDRLGSKITEPVPKRHKSRSLTPPRKVTLDGNRVEKVKLPRSRSRENAFRRDEANRDRDTRRVSEVKRVHEMGNRPREQRERIQKDFKNVDFNRGGNDRNRELHRSREPDRRRDFGQDWQDRESRQDRPRDRAWEQDRSRDKDRGKEWKRSPDRGREKNRDRFSSRENRSKDTSQTLMIDGRMTDQQKNKERERTKFHDEKREQSPSGISEKGRKDKQTKSEKDGKRKHQEDEKTPESEKKLKYDKLKDSNGHERLQRKKSTIDEANFVPDYDEQLDIQSTTHNTQKSLDDNDKKIDKIKDGSKERPSKDQGKTPEPTKRSRSHTESSSSSSSSDSESDSESDNNKKKKRSKHKKNKKKSRRSSSVESGNSTKRKRSKSKKKGKSSKKKKKSKK